jgi:hypothetical protein
VNLKQKVNKEVLWIYTSHHLLLIRVVCVCVRACMRVCVYVNAITVIAQQTMSIIKGSNEGSGNLAIKKGKQSS